MVARDLDLEIICQAQPPMTVDDFCCGVTEQLYPYIQMIKKVEKQL